MRGCYPRRFDDDGAIVSIDLHGCSVEDAMKVLGRTIREAHRRGRKQVSVITGVSTSERADPGRTIKTELQRRLDGGDFGQWISAPYWTDGGARCNLWLKSGPKEYSARIRLLDVVE